MRQGYISAMLSVLVMASSIWVHAEASGEGSGNWEQHYKVSNGEKVIGISHYPNRVCISFLCAKSVSVVGRFNGFDFKKKLLLTIDVPQAVFEQRVIDADLKILSKSTSAQLA